MKRIIAVFLVFLLVFCGGAMGAENEYALDKLDPMHLLSSENFFGSDINFWLDIVGEENYDMVEKTYYTEYLIYWAFDYFDMEEGKTCCIFSDFEDDGSIDSMRYQFHWPKSDSLGYSEIANAIINEIQLHCGDSIENLFAGININGVEPDVYMQTPDVESIAAAKPGLYSSYWKNEDVRMNFDTYIFPYSELIEANVQFWPVQESDAYQLSNVDPFGLAREGGCLGLDINHFLNGMKEGVDFSISYYEDEKIYEMSEQFYYMDFPEKNAYVEFSTDKDSTLINRFTYYFSSPTDESGLISSSAKNIYEEIEAVYGEPLILFTPPSSENSREITKFSMILNLISRTEGDYFIYWNLDEITIVALLNIGENSTHDIGLVSFEANKLKSEETIDTSANFNSYSDSITGTTFLISNKWQETTTYTDVDGLEYTEFTHVDNKNARITFCRADMWANLNSQKNNQLEEFGVSRSFFNLDNIYSKEELAANMNCDIDDIGTITYAGYDYYFIYMPESDETFFMTLINGYYYGFMLHSSAHAYFEDFEFLLNNISYVE